MQESSDSGDEAKATGIKTDGSWVDLAARFTPGLSSADARVASRNMTQATAEDIGLAVLCAVEEEAGAAGQSSWMQYDENDDS